MSEAMSYFRKNQKVILAVTGVVCIISFTVGSFILDWISSSAQNAPGEVTVVTWKGGRINEMDLGHMVAGHARAVAAVRNVAFQGLQKGGEPHGYDVSIQQGRFGIEPGRSEDDVVMIMVLAQKAKAMGLSVSDDAVKQFLKRLGGGQLQDGDIKKILQESLGERMNLAQFFEQMKIELLAQNMRYLSRTGMYALPPSEAYAYYERLHRSGQVETVPVKVEDYLDKVTAKPTASELRTLYDEYKDYIAVPQLPEPGFRVPRKVAIQFVKADFAKFLEEEKAKISEEAVKAEYEKRIAAGDFKTPKLPELPLEPEKKEPESKDPAPGEPKPEETPAEPKKEDDKPAEPKAEEKPAEPKAEEKPAEPKAEEKPAEPKPEEKPAEEKPAEPKTEDQKSEEKPAEPKPDNVALVSGELFVSAQDEAIEKKNDADAQPADETKPAEPKADDEKKAEEKPAEPKPEDKPAEEKPTDPPTGDKPAETPKPETTVPAAETPAFQPLEKVRDQILTSLAREPAQKRLDAAFDTVRKQVITYSRQTQAARTNAKQDPSKKPEDFDVAKAAKAAGLEYEVLALADAFKMQEHEIGRTSLRTAGQFGNTLPFTSSAYQQDKPLYAPEQVGAMFSQTEFLYWLTAAEADFVPKFDDCRKEVAKAWTFRAARKLAQAEAEKLAKEATNAKSLKDTFADRATESAMFSWLTQGFTPFGMGEPQFSEVKGVDTPGTAFMQRVFTLKVGETGVAPNNPETVYYVIRAIKFAPDEAVIRDMFVGSGPQRVFQAISPIASRERQQMERNWLSDLEKEYKVTWLRDARQLNDEM